MANSDESFGQDMLREPANELLVRERHLQFLCTFSIVFVLEGDLSILSVFDAVVTDSDLVGIAPKIFHHCLRTLKGSFGIYHPRFMEQAVEKSLILLWKSPSQTYHKPGSENLTHCLDRKEELAFASGRLPFTLFCYSTPWHNTMQMGMQG